MASSKYHIPPLLFLTSLILSFLGITISDNPCPYPCYPPPIGGTTPSTTQSPPAALTPPSQQSGVASYSPPAGYYPSPSGNLPNYPTPPYGGGNNFYGPPPPDHIVPYFPFYYRKPPHKPDESSSALTILGKSRVRVIAVTNLAVLVFLGASFSV